MYHLTLPWADWRAVIDRLRAQGLPYMAEHAALVEQKLEEHGPDEAAVRLSFSDDVFLRSIHWATVVMNLDAPFEQG